MSNDHTARSGTRRALRLTVLLVAILVAAACSRPALLDQAQQSWDQGDYAAAASSYEQFLKENPNSGQAADVRFRVATVCSRDLRQYDRAIEHYIRLIEDHPRFPDLLTARRRLAECYAAVEKRNEAISEYETLLPLLAEEKEKRRLRLNIAELYYEKNDLRQAVVEYQKVVDNAGYDELTERAHLRLGQIRYLRDEFEEALPAYQAVIDQTRDPVVKRVAQLGKVDCHERILQFDQAIGLLQEIAPDHNDPDYVSRRIAELREQKRQRSLIPSTTLDWSRK